jgi:Transglycosylase SLT domain
VIRSLAAVLAALEFVAPKFEHAQEASAHVRALAIEHDLDPFTIVAVVRHESGWKPEAVNPRTGALGLGQIMPSNYRVCREQPEGAECVALKSSLLEWKYNLSETAKTLATWRDYCGRKVGSRLAIHWLPGYQGLDMDRRATCGHRQRRGRWIALKSVPKLTQRILARRRELEKRFAKRR